jgi:protein-S-isoprenylcysteine O-methyltransferase Ste14
LPLDPPEVVVVVVVLLGVVAVAGTVALVEFELPTTTRSPGFRLPVVGVIAT